jgi:hypothetical protein
MDAKSLLLRTALRHMISEPNIEAAFERFQAVAGQPIDFQSFCDGIAVCLREGLVREPVRLPEGALQCHWHLELTSAGVEAARSIVMAGPRDGPAARPRTGSGQRSTPLTQTHT